MEYLTSRHEKIWSTRINDNFSGIDIQFFTVQMNRVHVQSPVELISKIVPLNRALGKFVCVVATNSDLRLFIEITNLNWKDFFIDNVLIIEFFNQ